MLGLRIELAICSRKETPTPADGIAVTVVVEHFLLANGLDVCLVTFVVLVASDYATSRFSPTETSSNFSSVFFCLLSDV